VRRYNPEQEVPSASQEAATEKNAEFGDKAKAKLKLAVFLCELIAGAQSGGTVLTPGKVSLGVLLLLGGLHRRTHTLLSAQQLCCSSTTANLITKGLMEQKQVTLKNRVNSLQGRTDHMNLVMIDNYCTQQYQKNKHSDQAFTHLCATVAVLMADFRGSGLFLI
jgi:hypothetical protein